MMKHIQLFENYTDDELRNLIGDLRGVGHSNMIFNVDMSRAAVDHKVERDECENWVSENDPNVQVTRVDGHIINNNSPDDIDLKVNLSNGDKFEFVLKSPGGFWDSFGEIKIITSKGKEINKGTGKSIYNYPGGWILSALTLYDELTPR